MPSTSKLGTFNILDETGIFSTACRHGIIQVLQDMIKSGELYVASNLSIKMALSNRLFPVQNIRLQLQRK
jgi:hypothetical protein